VLDNSVLFFDFGLDFPAEGSLYVLRMQTMQHIENEGENAMRTLRFGIEIETVGQTRERVAQAIQQVVGGTTSHVGAPFSYDPWHVTDARGRTWKVVADSSLNASRDRQAEVVSPVLTYEDLPELQEIVRALRAAGAKADSSCGIHVHVEAARFGAKGLRNLVKIVNKQERLIEHALGISEARRARWCRGIDQAFLDKIEKQRPRNLEDINRAWYGYHNIAPIHYDASRYHGVNLHNVWFRGTVEYRWFDGTLHAGKIKAYIQFVLALSAKAMRARSSCSKRREFNPDTARYDFRVFLLHLDLIGDEFKTAWLHLMANLNGSAAWKHGRPEQHPAA
jgi:hypothetical protein